MILHNPTAHLEFLKNFFRDTKTHCTYTWEFCRIFVEFLSFFSLMLYFDKILLSHFVSKCFAFPLPLVGKLEIKEKLGHKYIKLQYVNESMYIHCNKSCGKILFSSSQILGGSWKPHRHFELPPLCSFSAPVTLSQWGKIFFFAWLKFPAQTIPLHFFVLLGSNKRVYPMILIFFFRFSLLYSHYFHFARLANFPVYLFIKHCFL